MVVLRCKYIYFSCISYHCKAVWVQDILPGEAKLAFFERDDLASKIWRTQGAVAPSNILMGQTL